MASRWRWSIGTVCLVDLRLLGLASAKQPYRALAGEVLPWTWAAFWSWAHHRKPDVHHAGYGIFGNAAFPIKLLLLALAGLNMLIFETVSARDAANWDGVGPVPWPGRLAAVFH